MKKTIKPAVIVEDFWFDERPLEERKHSFYTPRPFDSEQSARMMGYGAYQHLAEQQKKTKKTKTSKTAQKTPPAPIIKEENQP